MAHTYELLTTKPQNQIKYKIMQTEIKTIKCTPPTFRYCANISLLVLRQQWSKKKPNEEIVNNAIASIMEMADIIDDINKTPEPFKELMDAVIDAQIKLLEHITEHDHIIPVDQVANINDILDFVEVAYKKNSPDGDRQQEYADKIEKGETRYIDFQEATNMLSIEFKNTHNNSII